MVYQSGRRDVMLGLSISRTAASAKPHLQRKREREREIDFEAELTLQCRHFPVHMPNLLQDCGGCGAARLRFWFINYSLSCPSTRTLATVLRTFLPQLLDSGPKLQKKLTLSSGHLNLNKRRVSDVCPLFASPDHYTREDSARMPTQNVSRACSL